MPWHSMGTTPRPFSRHVDISPALPTCVEKLSVKDVAIGGGHLSLTLLRAPNGTVQLQVDDNPDGLRLTIHPVTPGRAVDVLAGARAERELVLTSTPRR